MGRTNQPCVFTLFIISIKSLRKPHWVKESVLFGLSGVKSFWEVINDAPVFSMAQVEERAEWERNGSWQGGALLSRDLLEP